MGKDGGRELNNLNNLIKNKNNNPTLYFVKKIQVANQQLPFLILFV